MSIEPTPEEYDKLGRALLARARSADRRKRLLGLLAVGASAIVATAVLGGIVRVPGIGDAPATVQAQGSLSEEHEPGPASGGREAGPQLASAEVEVACYPSASFSAAPVTVGRQPLAFKASASAVEDQARADCRAVWLAGVNGAAAYTQFSADSQGSASSEARDFLRTSSAHLQVCRRSSTQYVVFPDTDLAGNKLCEQLNLTGVQE
ncbi:MAG: hypothetical protein J0H64_09320 [Actinobacteria bacterium]|nr:hypothetical protein [Actinomycetota bacterium]